MDNNRISQLDSLRGIAAMIVVIFHCLLSFSIFYNANYNEQYANGFIKLMVISPLHTFWAGNEAVLLFFVLSGFVLSIPFMEGRAPKYRAYIIKRVFRIYVPYIVVMAASVILVTVFASYKDFPELSPIFDGRWDHSISLKAIVAYVFMINYDTANVNGVVWTLYHEMRISIIFPLFMLAIVNLGWKSGFSISIAVTAFMWVVLRFVATGVNNDMISSVVTDFRWTVYYFIFFILGSFIARFRTEIFNELKNRTLTKSLILIASLILVNFKWIYEIIDVRSVHIDNFIPSLGIALLFCVAISSARMIKILNFKPFLWLGKISYSLYLTHIIVIMLTSILLSRIVPIGLLFISIPLLTLPVAYLSHKFIETKAIKFGYIIASQTNNNKMKAFIPKEANVKLE
jgi:peptidoglycan/LPS O-acetylase OafA/YrhL